MTDQQNPYDTTNPYEAPKASLEREAEAAGGRIPGKGTFDLGECFRDGWQNTIQNLGPILGVGILGYALMILSAITIVGIFLLVPIFAWGMTLFLLRVHDGKTEFNDLFAGFKKYGEVLVKMLVLIVLMTLLGLVGSLVQYVGMFAESDALTLIGMLISWAWSLTVMIRFYWAPLFMVDQDMDGVAALKASWEASKGNWLLLIALSILTTILFFAGMLALLVGLVIAIPMGYLMYVSAYRQVVGGPAPATTSFS